jgi:hypothetical protein
VDTGVLTGGDRLVSLAVADDPDHMQLRGPSQLIAMTDQQAAKVVTLADGSLVFVLGCPGGRVRVVRPGAFRTDGATLHGLGSIDSSRDLGLGGPALAVRPEGTGSNQTIRIWPAVAPRPSRRSARRARC